MSIIRDKFEDFVRKEFELNEGDYYYYEIDGFLDHLDVEDISYLCWKFYVAGSEEK